MRTILKTNETLANAIRRSVNKIPILAIDEVEIHKNDSALYDENLAHRMGLIPLKSNREIEERKQGDEANTKNQIQISLQAKGPKTVYSGDVEGDVEMIYDKIPLVILDKGQELKLVGFAQLGKGENHAKFSPGLAFYRNVVEISIKNDDKIEEIEEKLKGKIEGEPKKLKKGEKYICYEDEDYIESIFGEKIEIKKLDSLVFFIESWGQIKPKEIFSESVNMLNKELKEVSKILK